MIEKWYVLCDQAGLHMRPATKLAEVAQPFSSAIALEADGKAHDAKVATTLLLAKIEYGTHVLLRVDGKDEAAAFATLDAFMLEQYFCEPRSVLAGSILVPGYALAKAAVLRRDQQMGGAAAFSSGADEKKRLDAAIKAVHEDCLKRRDQAIEKRNTKQADIYSAHAALVGDADFTQAVHTELDKDARSAARAVERVIGQRIQTFETSGNPVLIQRVPDLKDLQHRLYEALGGRARAARAKGDVVLVAEEIFPSDLAEQDGCQIKGVITTVGSVSSHAAIIAQSLGIPMLRLREGADLFIRDEYMVILDGAKGEARINPDAADIEQTGKRIAEQAKKKQELEAYAQRFASTIDGTNALFTCNIGLPQEAATAAASGADGVGLFRTELMFMNRGSPPDEEEQFEAYKHVVESFGDREVVIRTLDIGADKLVPYLQFPAGENPLFGTRGIRYSLSRPDLFLTQLRAILRASAHGKVCVMFPFVATIEEFRAAKALTEQAKEELQTKQQAYDLGLKVGLMVELPSVAVLADAFAQEADFFSVGTNDLMQYLFAAERVTKSVEHLLSPYHPAVLRLIRDVAFAAACQNIHVSICGRIGEDPLLLPVFLALGVKKLSVGCSQVAVLKEKMTRLDLCDSHMWLDQILKLASADEVLACLKERFGEDERGACAI